MRELRCKKEIDENRGVATWIRGLGFCKMALLMVNPEWEWELYGRSPGANATFSVFETLSQKSPQRPFYIEERSRKAILAPKSDFGGSRL